VIDVAGGIDGRRVMRVNKDGDRRTRLEAVELV
jgi:hypothetical protein